jgi:hypothetical protein
MQLQQAIEMIQEHLEAEVRECWRGEACFFVFNLPRPICRGRYIYHVGFFTPTLFEGEETACAVAIAPGIVPFSLEQVDTGEISREEAARAAEIPERWDYQTLPALIQDVFAVARSVDLHTHAGPRWVLDLAVRPSLPNLERLEATVHLRCRDYRELDGFPTLEARETVTHSDGVTLALGFVHGTVPFAILRDWLEENCPALGWALYRGQLPLSNIPTPLAGAGARP